MVKKNYKLIVPIKEEVCIVNINDFGRKVWLAILIFYASLSNVYSKENALLIHADSKKYFSINQICLILNIHI